MDSIQNERHFKVVHLSPSLIAGSPAKLSHIQNKYGGHYIAASRCITVHSVGSFDKDIHIADHNNLELSHTITKILQEADIFHFHNFGDEFSLEFNLDLIPFVSNKRLVLEYHSDPDFILNAAFYNIPANKKHKKSKERVHRRDITILGATTRTSKLYDAIYFPNVIDVEEKRFESNLRFLSAESPIVIMHASTNRPNKGTDFVIEQMRLLEQRHADRVVFQLVENTPYDDCLRLKRYADISIGDMSGKYKTFHMSELESLTFGNVVICDIDDYCINTLELTTKVADSCPFVVANRDNFLEIMEALLSDRNRINSLKQRSYEFMRTFWHPHNHVKTMFEIYRAAPIYNSKERINIIDVRYLGNRMTDREKLELYLRDLYENR